MIAGAGRWLLAAAALLVSGACVRPASFVLPVAAHVLLVGPTDESYAPIRDLEVVGDVFVTSLGGERGWILAYGASDVSVPTLPVASRARGRSPGSASYLPFAAPRELWQLTDDDPIQLVDVRALPLAPDARCGDRPTRDTLSLERVLVSASSRIRGSARTSSHSVAFFTREGELGVVHAAAATGEVAEVTTIPVPGVPAMRPSAIAWDPVAEELLILRQLVETATVQLDLLVTADRPRAAHVGADADVIDQARGLRRAGRQLAAPRAADAPWEPRAGRARQPRGPLEDRVGPMSCGAPRAKFSGRPGRARTAAGRHDPLARRAPA